MQAYETAMQAFEAAREAALNLNVSDADYGAAMQVYADAMRAYTDALEAHDAAQAALTAAQDAYEAAMADYDALDLEAHDAAQAALTAAQDAYEAAMADYDANVEAWDAAIEAYEVELAAYEAGKAGEEGGMLNISSEVTSNEMSYTITLAATGLLVDPAQPINQEITFTLDISGMSENQIASAATQLSGLENVTAVPGGDGIIITLGGDYVPAASSLTFNLPLDSYDPGVNATVDIVPASLSEENVSMMSGQETAQQHVVTAAATVVLDENSEEDAVSVDGDLSGLLAGSDQCDIEIAGRASDFDTHTWNGTGLDSGTTTISHFHLGEDHLRFDDLLGQDEALTVDTLVGMLQEGVLSLQLQENGVLVFEVHDRTEEHKLLQTVEIQVEGGVNDVAADFNTNLTAQAELLQQMIYSNSNTA